MTTKVLIVNDVSSNGDVDVKGYNTCEGKALFTLVPGEKRELWITDHSVLVVTETWPSKTKPAA